MTPMGQKNGVIHVTFTCYPPLPGMTVVLSQVNVLFPLPSEDPLVSDRRIIQIDRQVELPSESPQVGRQGRP